MTLDLHALADAALSLDAADRLALASVLIDSVEDATEPAWRQEWTTELRQRSSEADGREVRGSSWEAVRSRLLGKLAAR